MDMICQSINTKKNRICFPVRISTDRRKILAEIEEF